MPAKPRSLRASRCSRTRIRQAFLPRIVRCQVARHWACCLRLGTHNAWVQGCWHRRRHRNPNLPPSVEGALRSRLEALSRAFSEEVCLGMIYIRGHILHQQGAKRLWPVPYKSLLHKDGQPLRARRLPTRRTNLHQCALIVGAAEIGVLEI